MQTKKSPINTNQLIARVKQDPVLKEALDLAKKVYAKDRRVYTGVAYFSHPLTTATLILEFCDTSDALVTAALEDVLHMKKITVDQLKAQFPAQAAAIEILTPPDSKQVADLTAYRDRLAAAAPWIQTVKIASMLDIACAVPAGKLKHASASFLNDFKILLPGLAKGDAELLRRLTAVIARATA